MGGHGRPAFFAKIGRALFFSLLALLIVNLVQMFFFPRGFGIVDYVAAGIFSLYIAYDYTRAQTIPKTLDNAVDVCITLYLDVINLSRGATDRAPRYRWRDSNPHGAFAPTDFKSVVSAISPHRLTD